MRLDIYTFFELWFVGRDTFLCHCGEAEGGVDVSADFDEAICRAFLISVVL